jgi:hypothetical protein
MTEFADPAPAERLERAAAALTGHGFTVEILDDVAAARTRIKDLIPDGASVFTGASETLRLSGIEEDISASGRYQAVRPRVLDRGGAEGGARPRHRAAPGRGALPAAGGRPRPAGLREPSAVNRLLILNAEFQPGRGAVLLLREVIGF